MYTNINLKLIYVHKYKAYIKICPQMYNLYTDINLVINHVLKCKSYTI
jgi:hypothetical protein